MPAYDPLGRHEGEVLAPAGTPSASQDPEHFVPGAQPSTPSGSGGPGQHRELVAQQDVLEDEVLARAQPGKDDHVQQPDEFEHVLSISRSTTRAGFSRLTTVTPSCRRFSPAIARTCASCRRLNSVGLATASIFGIAAAAER
jgi:hypothetical protein